MNVTTTLDTHGFTAFIDDLARLSGRTFEEALLDQTAALLRLCMKHTSAAKVGNIVKRVSAHNNHIVFEDGSAISMWKREPGSPTMFLDTSNWREPRLQTAASIGRRPHAGPGGKTWHQVEGGRNPRRWSNERWARYKAYEGIAKTRRIDLKAARGARGVSKQSWLQIAQELGLNLDPPAFVVRAKRTNGREYKNGTARRMLEATAAFIEISNADPIVVGRLNGARILQKSIDARLKAFGIEMRKGVFDDIAARARRYPGLFTKPA